MTQAVRQTITAQLGKSSRFPSRHVYLSDTSCIAILKLVIVGKRTVRIRVFHRRTTDRI